MFKGAGVEQAGCDKNDDVNNHEGQNNAFYSAIAG